ncbi:alpha-glucosidase [Rhodococcus antarcticus]|uniref:Alpha-glucosidase n=1 Tax=Rhodococcus antarcticus TaxID=2987751 RepID=A0ABY6NXD8_9NOCA|nr:alpha-glucosidase [Rhodococcus antarcticus]UZJ24047.1 alpha-glucosidase [Rhodococcus antarcticus]
MTPPTPPWWSTAVVYQVYPRSFADSDGDGIGDLRGVLSHLDHLAALGVDVVWLSPIYRSPQDDNGYDISDYRDVDPVFGTLADLDELLATLHARGMRLVMDLVVNHTSDEHPWFVESRSSTTNPKRDWYVWRGGRDGGERPPNNWGAAFSGPAWDRDTTTGQWYLHLFSPKQPDLNWENPEVRAAVHEMVAWWLDRGVDGFRMDVVNFVSKVDGLPDGVVAPGALFGDGAPHFQNGPRLHEFLHELHERVFAGRPQAVLTVGEMPGVTVEQARLLTDPARAEVDMVFQFEHVGLDHGRDKWDPRPLELRELKANLARWQTGLADVGWNSLYWSNHDQPRAVSRFGDDSPAHRVASAMALGTVLHLHRGTPYVYQGEELGMTNAVFASLAEHRDLESLNHHREAVGAGADPDVVLAALAPASRDNARTPVQWTPGTSAGFSTGAPWIGVHPNHVDVNAEAARADPGSVFHHYRRLVELRHTDPVVTDGVFALLLAEHEQVWAFTRTTPTAQLLVVANVSSAPVTLDGAELAELGGLGGEVVLSSGPAGDRPAQLGAWEARVLRRRAAARDPSSTRGRSTTRLGR